MADTRSSLASRGSDGADALDVLTRQHREVESLWAEVEGAGFAMSSSRTDTARQIVRLLSQHDAIETQVLYPELRDVGGDEGQRLSDDSLSDHRVIREMLKEIDRADDLDDRAYSALARCIAAVNHHIEEVEDVVFPLLRKNCSPERLQELGSRMASMMGTSVAGVSPGDGQRVWTARE
jgi:hemerythrin-like domain-containing protein